MNALMDDYSDATEAPRSDSHGAIGWLGIPLLIAGVALPVMIFMTVDGEHLPGILVAYLNCVIIGCALVYLGSRRTIESMVPLIVLPLMMVAWPLSSIYYAVSGKTDAVIELMDRASLPFLQDNLRLQLVVLTFLLGYLPIVLIGARRRGPVPPPYIPNYRRWVNVCLVILVIAFAPFLVVRTLNLPFPWLPAGIMKYSQGVMFLCGVYFFALSKKSKLFLLSFVGGILFYTTITSDRGLIAFAVLVGMAGAFFLGPLTQKAKIGLMTVILVGLPMFVLIGNTTRLVMGGKRTVQLREQYEIMKQWRDIQGDVSAIESVLARAHWTGGHAILSTTPEDLPFWDLNPVKYITEGLSLLLPAIIYYDPYYHGNWMLTQYGLRINEVTSVEVSLLGHLWLLGGYPIVFIGALACGLMHFVLMWRLRAVHQRSELRAMTQFGVVSILLITCTGIDLLYQFRSLVWYWLFGWVTYHLLRMITRADQPFHGDLAEAGLPDDLVAGDPDADRWPVRETAYT